MRLRPYQQAAVNAVFNEWYQENHSRTLAILPTGCGKTVIFSEITKREVREKQHKVLILAHREELLLQAQDKLFKTTGLYAELEKGKNSTLDSNTPVVIGSIQTLCRTRRLNQFTPDTFDCIIIDEAHHCLSESYQRVLWYFKNAHVLGVTATPDRGDKKELAEYFNSTAYQYNLLDAIKDGYLTPINLLKLDVSIDLSTVHIKNGDYDENDLGESIRPYLYDIALKLKANCFSRKIAVFLPLISISQEFAEIMNEVGFNAVEVNGSSQDRQEKLQAFERGEYNVITNAMLLCLDKETEILTTRGFLNSEELTMEDAVANWCSDGSVFFEKPKDIVHRFLEPNEHMVAVETSRTNFRVTNTHRMIVNYGANRKGWKKIAAEELNNRHILPAYGLAEPINITVEQEDNTSSKHAINNCVYHLTQKGMPRDEARAEAIKRAEEFQKLHYKNPDELTLDECRFIGFWIADGSATHLQRGGIEYFVAQSQRYTHICEWIDRIIQNCGFDVIKKTRRPDKKTSFCSFKWSFSRGTGRGIQKRKGVYSIEPYLKKDGTNLFWGLNEKQFDALIEGFWFGDGRHGDGKDGLNGHFHATNTNKKLIDLFCAIGSVRGWKCTVQTINLKNKNFHTQYGLTMIKGKNINLSEKTVIKHENYANEEVWCVRTTSKNIITRRKGKVTVMGNTEGWDCPSVDCIVVLRPTKIRSLYAQMVGRGLRLSPETGKKDCQLVDFMWLSERHDLCSASCLVCETDEQSRILQEMMSETAEIDLMTAAQEANKKLLEEEDEEPKEKGSTEDTIRQNLIKNLNILNVGQDSMIDVVNHEDIYKWEQEPASEKQIQMLEKNGFKLTNVSKGMASKIISIIIDRTKNGLATFKQVKTLKSHGLKNPEKWSMDEASRCISYLVANRWYIAPDKLEQINEVMTRRYA